MSTVTAILKSVPIPASDLALIGDVNRRLVEIGEIDRKCRPDPHQWNQFGWLHFEVERLAALLAESPSIEAAEAVHQATTRLHTANLSIGPIADALRVAADRIRAELNPVLARVFDQASEKLSAEISARRAELSRGTTTVFDIQGELAAHDAKGVQLLAALEAERAGALANPVGWLTANGIGVPEVPEPTAKPTPTPAPPLVRGRQKLPEPKADNDVLSILAELEADE